jgi:hypothetical protein
MDSQAETGGPVRWRVAEVGVELASTVRSVGMWQ